MTGKRLDLSKLSPANLMSYLKHGYIGQYIDKDYQAWLKTCSPFKAKVHISAMSDIFATLNNYLPVEQRVRISLKVPVK